MNASTFQPPSPSSADPAKILYGAQRMADALGIGRNTVDLMRKASRILNDPIPRYATADDVKAWLKRYPMFVGKHWVGEQWRTHLAKYTDRDRPTSLAGKSGEPQSRRDQPIP